MKSRHADVEHPAILPIVPSQAALLPKGLPLIERLKVSLHAFSVVVRMDNFCQATLKIGFREPREVQPKLIEISTLFVRSGHPDHHRCSVGYQTEAFLAFSYCLLSTAALRDILQNTSDAIDTDGTFNRKVGDEYVSFAKPRIRVFHLVSDDFTRKASIQFLFHLGIKNSLVQHLRDEAPHDLVLRHIPVFQKLTICNHVAVFSVNDRNHLV